MDDVILEVRHLSHRFKLTRKLAVQALDDLSFQVRRGEIFGSPAPESPPWHGA